MFKLEQISLLIVPKTNCKEKRLDEGRVCHVIIVNAEKHVPQMSAIGVIHFN